jgi:putative glutamine amidotransferase
MKTVLTVRDEDRDAGPYEEALRMAGIEPVVVSGSEPTSLDGVSGLLLMGGTDVNPALYGQVRQPETDEPDDARDRLEIALIGEALSRDLPILAICRGLQILNVQQGGTLIQDMAGHRVRTPEDPGRPAHEVAIAPGTKLAQIMGERSRVNSRHHQAIAGVGGKLLVSARDPRDGTIEAVERPDKKFVVAVQWHPENQVAAREDQARLFSAFAAAL